MTDSVCHQKTLSSSSPATAKLTSYIWAAALLIFAIPPRLIGIGYQYLYQYRQLLQWQLPHVLVTLKFFFHSNSRRKTITLLVTVQCNCKILKVRIKSFSFAPSLYHVSAILCWGGCWWLVSYSFCFHILDWNQTNYAFLSPFERGQAALALPMVLQHLTPSFVSIVYPSE